MDPQKNAQQSVVCPESHPFDFAQGRLCLLVTPALHQTQCGASEVQVLAPRKDRGAGGAGRQVAGNLRVQAKGLETW
jgi:hypothetical protein